MPPKGTVARRPRSGSGPLEQGAHAQLAQMQIFSGGVARTERALVAGTDGSVEQVRLCVGCEEAGEGEPARNKQGSARNTG
mmetsp:Transcript_41230/g.95820  ORF Transcript_41230/g.95820 Transcript_41230/m.95820 type:complete len:81 (+) Transcript_41230:93-335(+)